MSDQKDACIAAEMLLKEFLAEAKEIISKEAERCEWESDADGFVRMDGITPRGLEECVMNDSDGYGSGDCKEYHDFLARCAGSWWLRNWSMTTGRAYSELVQSKGGHWARQYSCDSDFLFRFQLIQREMWVVRCLLFNAIDGDDE